MLMPLSKRASESMMIPSHLYPGKDALTSFDVHEYFLRQVGSSAKRSRILSLRGKRVLLLGGTSGIGLAVAEAAAREGATPIVASSNAANVHAALARLRSLFERIVAFDHLVFSAGESLELGRPADTRLDEARKFFELP
jgi:NADPH:quinone reductase-like Zn-dependent oxidoreductase